MMLQPVGSCPDHGRHHRLFVGGHIAESASEAAEGSTLRDAGTINISTAPVATQGSRRFLSGKITADYIWKNLIDERTGYTARLNTPGQPMFQKWASSRSLPEQRAAILRWDREPLQRAAWHPSG
ncbi:MAG: hypothetical protein R3C56_37355 [Pirellulaceae bacterium]